MRIPGGGTAGRIAGLSGYECGQQATALREYEEADRAKGFDFKAAPLMRLALMRWSEECYHMLWTFHHILLDGWSLPVMMQEFLSTYETLRAGQQVARGQEDRYEDYIRYVERGIKSRRKPTGAITCKGSGKARCFPL